jgi:splicing factor 3A subunit 1
MVISGLIRPPPEIRAVADRTAAYVAKNGRAFENRILSSAKGKTPKFAFLQQSSPFHAYYEDRIQFYENGGEDEEEDGDKDADESKKQLSGKKSSTANKKEISAPKVRKQHKRQKASAMEPIAKALLDQRTRIAAYRSQQEKEEKRRQKASENEKEETNDDDDDNGDDSKPAPIMEPLKPPPPLDFVSIVAPSNLSPTQIETIQLVAQFTAMDGKGGPFLHQLTVREWKNPDFGFIQPRHVHFAYFSALVDAYRKIIQEWTSPDALSPPSSNDDDNHNEDGKNKPTQFITPQMVLQDVAYRVEYERDLEENQQEEGEIIPINWHDFVVVETIDFPADEIVEAMLPPPPSLLPPVGSALQLDAAAVAAAGTAATGEEEMDESDDDEEEGETIRVVPTYTPKVVGTMNLSGARAIDPITGKSVAVSDMPEHMRIQLLDPKWAEERKKFQDKQKDSNLVGDEAIVSNINRLARAREAEDQDGKSGLSGQEEANRILREQGQGPGPSLPPPPPPPPSMHTGTARGQPRPAMVGEPDPKRQKLDPNAVPLPPQPSGHQQQQFKVTRAPPVLPNPSSSTAQAGYQQQQSNSAGDVDVSTTGPVIDNEPTLASDIGLSVVEPTPGPAPLVERTIVPEQDFILSLEKPEVTLNVRVPNDPTQMAWNFYGQIVTVTVNVMMKVKDVKAELSKQHLNDMPPNKIEIRDAQGSGFLKNSQTLASLNIGPVANLEMKVKQRGTGRKG